MDNAHCKSEKQNDQVPYILLLLNINFPNRGPFLAGPVQDQKRFKSSKPVLLEFINKPHSHPTMGGMGFVASGRGNLEENRAV